MDETDATYSDNYNKRLLKTKPSFILNEGEVKQVLNAFSEIIEKLEIKTDATFSDNHNKRLLKEYQRLFRMRAKSGDTVTF